MIRCGHGAGKAKRNYLGSMYGRLAARRGKQRAAVATRRTILQIAYHMLSRGTGYEDLDPQYFELLDRERTSKRHIRQLQFLGYDVQVTERCAA